MKKIRVIRYHIHPEIVVDDGENLNPLPVQPITINGSGWQQFVDAGLQEALSQLQTQIESQA